MTLPRQSRPRPRNRRRALLSAAAAVAAGCVLTAALPAAAPRRAAADALSPTPRFSVNDIRVDESAGTAVFTVSVSAPVSGSLNVATVDGTASAPADYTALATTAVTFTPTDSTQTVTVAIAQDSYIEPPETFALLLFAPSAGTAIADGSGTATIRDDDSGSPPQVSVGDVAPAAEGSTAMVPITVSGILDDPASVRYATAAGTAGSADFKATSGTLRFAAGTANPPVLIPVPITDDSLAEGKESFTVRITSATGVTIADAAGTVWIPLSDGGTGGAVATGPRASVADTLAREDDGAAHVVVSLTAAASGSVTLTTVPGAAASPADFTGVTRKVVFSAAGPTSQVVDVPVTADGLSEDLEQFTVKLSLATGGVVVADPTALVTLVDADPLPPQLQVSDVEPVTEGPGAAAVFTLRLAGTPTADITATVTVAPGTAVAADYGPPSATAVTFPAGGTDSTSTVSVPVVDDGVDGERVESFWLRVTAAPGADLADPVGAASIAADPNAGIDPVIATAGDIACAPGDARYNGGVGTANSCHQQATASLLSGRPLDAVLPLGDTQYEYGRLPDYAASYDPTWGRALSITHPVPGNHEYMTPGATGYYQYFGPAAGDPSQGWYSYDLGGWHLIALNAECAQIGGCDTGSAQESWLRSDLASHPAMCTLAYWHQPRFSSGGHGSDPAYDTFWQDLWAAGVEIVLNGHDHDYERFGPQTPAAVASPTGIREFVVGTGGEDHYGVRTIRANSEVRIPGVFGVLQLTLHPAGFDWLFVPEAGSTAGDSGSDTCH